ncbi:hypothetical protein CHS0354_001290 [Potamilus streckersoni]|uniref:C2H2-type domain-containing protein n=1 Tax=Potamilus streckersoni TaxID=2493646 RepID=A0AAE0S7B7_9BIVA|nr:hypothetical protein CHS0354_001290 [Potamilus streckersoni]
MGSYDKATIEYEEGAGELVVISRYKLDGDSPICSRRLDMKKIVAAVSILLFQPSADVEGSVPSTGHFKSKPGQETKDSIYPVPSKKRRPAVVPATISTVPVQGFWLPHLDVPSKNINTDIQDDIILITDHGQINNPEKMWHHKSQQKATSLDQICKERLSETDNVENNAEQNMHDILKGGKAQQKNTTIPELSHLSNLDGERQVLKVRQESVLSSTTAVIDLSEENIENTNTHFELNMEDNDNNSTAVDSGRGKTVAGDNNKGTTLAGDGGRTTNLAGGENESCQKPGSTSDHLQCLFCGKLLQNEKSIIEHSKDHLNMAQKNAIMCPVCNTNFPLKSSASFKSHVAGHFEYEPNVVQPSQFSVSHSARNPFEVFTADSEGMYTLNLTKYSDKNQVKKLVCQFCNSILKTHYEVVDHSVFHGQMQCAICRKSFSQKQCLSRHAAQHAQNIVYMCHICGTVFNRKDNLKRHIKCHDKGRFKPSSGKTWFARQCLRRACSTVQGRTNRDKMQTGNLNPCISMEQEIENEDNIAKDNWDNGEGAKDDAPLEDREATNEHSITAEVPQDIEKQPEYGTIEVKTEKMDTDEHDTCANNNVGLTRMNATPYDAPYENTHCVNSASTEASIFINSSLENTFTDVEHFSCIRCLRLFSSFDELKEHESVHHFDGLQFCNYTPSIKSQQKDVSEQGSFARNKVDQHCKSPSGFRGIEKGANMNVAVFSGEYGIRPGQSWQPPLPAHSPVAQGTPAYGMRTGQELTTVAQGTPVYGIRGCQELGTVSQETRVSGIKTGQELDSSINTIIKQEVIHVDETSSSSSHSEYQNFGEWVEFHSALRTSVQPASDIDPSINDPDAVPCRVVTGVNDQFRIEGRQSNMFHAATLPSGPSLPLDNSNSRQKSQEASFPVKCLLCNVMLNNPREIGDHSDQHGHIYACPFCKGQLSTKTTLLRHLNTHLDYTIPCQLCTAKFNRRDNLLRHLKTRHNIDKNNFDMNTLRYFIT